MALLLKENFEGASYDNAGWIEIAETGCTVVENSAIPGTKPNIFCDAQCLTCANVDATNNNAYSYWTNASNQDISYIGGYIYIASEGMADGQLAGYMFGLLNDGGLVTAMVYPYQAAGGQLQLWLAYYSGGAIAYDQGLSPFAVGTWYYAEIKYDVTNLAWQWWIDGVSQGSGALTAATRVQRIILTGFLSGNPSAANSVSFDYVRWNNSERVPAPPPMRHYKKYYDYRRGQ